MRHNLLLLIFSGLSLLNSGGSCDNITYTTAMATIGPSPVTGGGPLTNNSSFPLEATFEVQVGTLSGSGIIVFSSITSTSPRLISSLSPVSSSSTSSYSAASYSAASYSAASYSAASYSAASYSAASSFTTAIVTAQSSLPTSTCTYIPWFNGTTTPHNIP
jgi:hypothetical protein